MAAEIKTAPTFEELVARMEALEKSNVEKDGLIVKLSGSLAKTAVSTKASEPHKLPTDNFEVDGVEYKWLVPVFHVHEHGTMTAFEAALDEDILRTIVSMRGQGVAKKLV